MKPSAACNLESSGSATDLHTQLYCARTSDIYHLLWCMCPPFPIDRATNQPWRAQWYWTSSSEQSIQIVLCTTNHLISHKLKVLTLITWQGSYNIYNSAHYIQGHHLPVITTHKIIIKKIIINSVFLFKNLAGCIYRDFKYMELDIWPRTVLLFTVQWHSHHHRGTGGFFQGVQVFTKMICLSWQQP